MRLKLCSLLLAVFLFTPSSLYASQFSPRELGQLFDSSQFVVIGTVSDVTLVEDKGANGRVYETELIVVTPLKGNPSLEKIKIPTHVGGLTGFDLLFKKNQKGVFFFHTIENGKAKLTHSGSVALFNESYFK